MLSCYTLDGLPSGTPLGRSSPASIARKHATHPCAKHIATNDAFAPRINLRSGITSLGGFLSVALSEVIDTSMDDNSSSDDGVLSEERNVLVGNVEVDNSIGVGLDVS